MILSVVSDMIIFCSESELTTRAHKERQAEMPIVSKDVGSSKTRPTERYCLTAQSHIQKEGNGSTDTKGQQRTGIRLLKSLW